MVTAAAPLAAAPTVVTGIMTTEQMAVMCNTTEIAIKRGIARGDIKAASLESKPRQQPVFRIASADSDAYIRLGAPGLRDPKTDDTGWLADPCQRYVLAQMEESLIAASQSQKISDDDVAELCRRKPFNDTHDVELVADPKIREIFFGDPQIPRLPNKPDYPFKTVGDAWLAVKLIGDARAALDAATKAAPVVLGRAVERLYGGGQALYQDVVSRAVKRTFARYVVVASEHRLRPADDSRLQPQSVRISYGLKVSELTTESLLRQFAESIVF